MMAYNRYFINQRKSLKFSQINSSARISPCNEKQNTLSSRLPMKNIIEEARKSGILELVEYGLCEIPEAIYNINRPDNRTVTYDKFDNESSKAWWEDVLITKLDLSGNHISQIAGELTFLKSLLHLNLQSNDLKFVPEEIKDLSQLMYLNLSDNGIVTLPESIGMLDRLQQIHLGGNLLKYLPIEFCRLLALEVLDISRNELAYIPEFIGNFIRLKRLSLADNKVKKLPETISRLKALTYLDISLNKLVEFPKSLECSFEILRLNVNLLSNFPIHRLTPSLKELNIDNNRISTISAMFIAFIPNIRIFSLSKNIVNDLPNEITDLPSLTHLDISFNNLQSIPYALGNMDSLEVLSVIGNPFRSIKRTAMNSGTDILKRYLRTRSIGEDANDKTECPVVLRQTAPAILNSNGNNEARDQPRHLDVCELNSTGTVELSNFNLQVIPDYYFDILRFKQIRSVLFAHNKLTEFPTGLLPHAATIITLDISFNEILELRDLFHNFSSLQTFNLNGNYIRSLPESFACLKHSLTRLEVAYNPLGFELPAVIFQMTNLRCLNASGCAIIVINASNFLLLHYLENLDLSHNEIEIVPPELGLCRQIKTLRLDGNKIRHPALESANQATEAILEYLRSQIQQPL